jgi:hypothetical protein
VLVHALDVIASQICYHFTCGKMFSVTKELHPVVCLCSTSNVVCDVFDIHDISGVGSASGSRLSCIDRILL